MSGHSKWNNIKNKKAKTDAQKGKIFTKIGKEIAIAVREGGPDPSNNSKLRDLIAKAKSNNVPNDNIDRAIKKASGANAVVYEEIVYEGYGPSGVAVLLPICVISLTSTAETWARADACPLCLRIRVLSSFSVRTISMRTL